MKRATVLLLSLLLPFPVFGFVFPTWVAHPDNPLFDGLPFPPAAFASPSFLKEGGSYRVWGGSPNGTPIQHATSPDGVNWTPSVSTNLAPGSAGDFDQTHVLAPFVIYNPSLSRYEMWYEGQLATGFSDRRIGFAVSPDGLHWTKIPGSGTGGSVIDKHASASELVASPVVLLDDSGYRMWYFGADPGPTAPRGIFLATSNNGVDWALVGKVIDRIPSTPEDQGLLPESILRIGGELQLWYQLNSDLSAFNGTALATSRDGITWTRRGPVPFPVEAWCSGGEPQFCLPRLQHVIREGSLLEAWYARVGAGVADVGYATASAVVRIEIDIKPGSDPNSINPRSKGVIPVAVLTNADFDAWTLDPTTLSFGPGGAGIAHASGHAEDVDGDGDLDLVAHFSTQASQIDCETETATLTGSTFAGVEVEGTDAVRPVGCK